MEHAGKAVWDALKRISLSEQEKPLDFLAAMWPLVVGVRMAAHTEPVAWEKGRVEIAVSDREWQRQLERMGPAVCQQINKWWGTSAVREVSFSHTRATSSQQRRTTRREQKGKLAARKPKLETILKEFEKSLAGISDKQLRGLIARVAQKYLPEQER